MIRPHWAAALLAAALLAAPAGAATLTFDELPQDTALPVAEQGATFSFSNADAFYNSAVVSFPAGSAAYLDGAVLEGDSAGTLTVELGPGFRFLTFGVGLSSGDSLPSGAVVSAFDAANTPLGMFQLTTHVAVPGGPSEALFNFLFDEAVARLVLTFEPNAGRFYLDNFGFAVPEPSSVALLGAGLAAVAALARRHRAA